MPKSEQLPPTSAQICLESSKTIRNVYLLNKGTQLALMTYLEVIIIDITYGYIIKVIKRVSPPKCIAIIPNQNYMVIHYSDNYCILYDTTLFEEIYVIIGVPGDHRGIKPSDNGRHLLYGNNGGALQMWNVFDCKIELLSHKLKCFSTYEINWDGSQIYLGSFNGEIMFVRIVEKKEQYSGAMIKIPYCKQIRPHSKCVMAVQHIDRNHIISIDYSLECVIINTNNYNHSVLFKVEMNVPITKNVLLLYSQLCEAVYMNVNDMYYRINAKVGDRGYVGDCDKENGSLANTSGKGIQQAQVLKTKHKDNFLTISQRKQAYLCGLKQKYIIQLNKC